VKKFTQYWKTVVAVAAPVFMVVQSAVTDDVITQDEWTKIAVAVVAAVMVYLVPNAPKADAK
jgi:zinc transporter ZupT